MYLLIKMTTTNFIFISIFDKFVYVQVLERFVKDVCKRGADQLMHAGLDQRMKLLEGERVIAVVLVRQLQSHFIEMINLEAHL